jgi:hypothetical protein
MKIIYTLEALERKTLVKAIALQTGLKAEYLGVPSLAYQIGNLHIAKDGTLTGPDDRARIEALRDCHSFVSANEEYDVPAEEVPQVEEIPGLDVAPLEAHVAPEAAPAVPVTLVADLAETGAFVADVAEADSVCVEVPLEGFAPEALDRLAAMVAAKEALIKKALGIDELPIQVLFDRIAFPWFTSTDGAEVNAYAQFITALAKTAREKKRVTAKAPEDGFENESFAMRVWLIGLGLIGPEYKQARALLGRNLSGNSAYRDGGGIFTAHSYTFPDGDTKAESQCETTGFHSLAKARSFCDNLDQGECFAGAHVEDPAGKWVYEIPAD